jgi:hypothetical protein
MHLASVISRARIIRFSVCLTLASFICFAPATHAAKKPGRDRIAEALTLLNQAKEANNPIALLKEAKDEIEGTLIPHKDAERDKAIKAIADAITASMANNKEKEAISRAIASVHALAGDRKKKKK